jgi:hypothetical protein
VALAAAIRVTSIGAALFALTLCFPAVLAGFLLGTGMQIARLRAVAESSNPTAQGLVDGFVSALHAWALVGGFAVVASLALATVLARRSTVPPNAVPPNAVPPNAVPPNAVPPNAVPAKTMPANTGPAQSDSTPAGNEAARAETVHPEAVHAEAALEGAERGEAVSDTADFALPMVPAPSPSPEIGSGSGPGDEDDDQRAGR